MRRITAVGQALRNVVDRSQGLRNRARRWVDRGAEKHHPPAPISFIRRALPASRTPGADPSLPPGRHVIVASRLTLTYGGLTASMYARARAFSQLGGQPVDIVTLPAPHLDADPEAQLVDRGIIPESGVRIKGPHLHYSAHRWSPDAARLPPHPAPEPLTSEVAEARPDDTPIRVDRYDGGGIKLREEFLRTDGSVYLRRHVTHDETGSEWTDLVECLDHEGRVREQYPTMPALHRAWFEAEYPPAAEPVFMIIDGASAGRQLLSVKRPDLVRLLVVHNRHLLGDGRWDGQLEGTRASFFTKLDQLDGLVLLTDQQRHDVVLRYGPRRNLFTVSHAADPDPTLPDPARRDPDLIVALARLAPQKRLDHMVRAFKIIHDRRPSSRLRIYGTGPLEEKLRAQVAKLGLADAVQLLGHVPNASETFEVATLTMMSSVHEGQPIVILEALGKGCPMVSYDLKYGPAHMISSGFNGTLVPTGDVDALAEAALEVLTDPERAVEMSRNAWQSAAEFDRTNFLAQWGQALRTAALQRDTRTRFDAVTVTVSSRTRSGAGERIRAEVKITGQLPDTTDQLDVRWILVGRPSAEQLEGAASVTVRSASERSVVFTVDDVLDVDTPLAAHAPGDTAELHLDIVWNNSQERQAIPIA